MSAEGALEEGMEKDAELERDEGTVEYLCKEVGVCGVLGMEFNYRGPLQTRARRVRLDKFDFGRNAFKGTDVQANVGLVEDISPKNLTVSMGTRRRGELVIRLLEACNIGVRQFLDPMLREIGDRGLNFSTPPSDFAPYGRREIYLESDQFRPASKRKGFCIKGKLTRRGCTGEWAVTYLEESKCLGLTREAVEGAKFLGKKRRIEANLEERRQRFYTHLKCSSKDPS
jgi:hypothetical protein